MRQIILERFNQGDLARAYDLCLAALAQQPDDGWFKHRAVLCLVRSGALERAELDFRHFRLSEASHDEDSLALGARLSKSMALEASAGQVAPLAAVAADQYHRIFSETGGHYPGINAATLYLLAGDRQRSDSLAREVLASCRSASPADAEEAYYRLASQAEAHLLLGDTGAAHLALRSAIACHRRQFDGSWHDNPAIAAGHAPATAAPALASGDGARPTLPFCRSFVSCRTLR